jgi:hypothetical protein
LGRRSWSDCIVQKGYDGLLDRIRRIIEPVDTDGLVTWMRAIAWRRVDLPVQADAAGVSSDRPPNCSGEVTDIVGLGIDKNAL